MYKKIIKQCLECESEYTITTRYSYKDRERSKYCSKRCAARNSPTKFKKEHKGLSQDKNPAWRGGKRFKDNGYIAISMGGKKYQYEHRLVMEKHLNRKLNREEHVHHINGDKTDNRIENLQLISVAEHSKVHHKLRVSCGRR